MPVPFRVNVGTFTDPNPHPHAMKVTYSANAEVLSVLLWPAESLPAVAVGTPARLMYSFECKKVLRLWNNMLLADGHEAAAITSTAIDDNRTLVEVFWPADPVEVMDRRPFVGIVQAEYLQGEQYPRSIGLHHQVAAMSGYELGQALDGGKDLDTA